MLLCIQNSIPASTDDGSDEGSGRGSVDGAVAARIARRALSQRTADATGDVRRLLDAALEVMRRCGTTSRPRVADVVAAAGLSNEAFYRYFPSKDALVAALLEDGTDRLHSYLAHQMDKEATPADQVRRWVEGVLSQADEGIAETTLAVLFNAGGVADGRASGRHPASGTLATLLHDPFAALGSTRPGLDASLVAHAVLGRLADHLWAGTRPGAEEAEHVVAMCLGVTRSGGAPSSR
jgi:AcrR family transcriptional regulator